MQSAPSCSGESCAHKHSQLTHTSTFRRLFTHSTHPLARSVGLLISSVLYICYYYHQCTSYTYFSYVSFRFKSTAFCIARHRHPIAPCLVRARVDRDSHTDVGWSLFWQWFYLLLRRWDCHFASAPQRYDLALIIVGVFAVVFNSFRKMCCSSALAAYQPPQIQFISRSSFSLSLSRRLFFFFLLINFKMLSRDKHTQARASEQTLTHS